MEQRLLGVMATDLLARSGIAQGERIVLRVDAAPESWITRQSFAAALQQAGHVVAVADSAQRPEGTTIDIRAPSLSVRYTEPTEEGLFGTRRVRRTVSAEVSCLVTSLPAGTVRLSETVTRALSDSVRVDAVPGIESPGIGSTHGELPQDRFIDRIVEPFVIVGATGIAVFLLFNIRS